MKTIDTVIPDIYHMLEDKKMVLNPYELEAVADQFAGECRELFLDAMGPHQQQKGRLRLSALGKPARMLFKQFWGDDNAEKLKGPTYIKFLYGHLVEALVVALTRASGHEVTGQQKECEVEGVKGHLDCYVDGTLIDVKSASNYGFKKFAHGTLHKDDPFGYIPQLKAYAHSEGQTKYGWLAMDKSTGALAYLEYDEENPGDYAEAIDWDVPERVLEVKKLMEGELPSVCYQDVPDGKSGNRKLSMGCTFCEFKHSCWPELRRFSYSNGDKYLTVVDKTPRVKELPEGF